MLHDRVDQCGQVGAKVERMESLEFRIVHGRPAPALRTLVRGYWEVQGSLGAVRTKALPREEFSLIVNLGDPLALLARPGVVAQRFEDAWICGLQSHPILVEADGRSWRCGARLSPEGAFLLLGGAAAALVDQIAPLRDVMPAWGAATIDAVRRAANTSERFAAFDAAFAALLATPGIVDATLAWIVRAIRKGAPGGMSQIAAEVGWSRQRMHERFASRLGLAPKAFERLARFERALSALHAPAVKLAHVAHASGYYDQAHFTREFRAFAGETPADYASTRLDFADSAFLKQE